MVIQGGGLHDRLEQDGLLVDVGVDDLEGHQQRLKKLLSGGSPTTRFKLGFSSWGPL